MRLIAPMRRGVAAVALACVALGGASCADGESSTNERTTTSGDPTKGPDAYPLTVAHRFGETTLAKAPERIVTVGLTDHDALLAVGVVPVGVTEWFGGHPSATWPWARDELDKLVGQGATRPEVVSTAQAINFERIAALEPDLVLGLYAGLTAAQYETLSQIAPTIAQPDDYVDFGVPWAELTRSVGRIVGRPERAAAAIKAVNDSLASVRSAQPEFSGATGLVASPHLNGVYVYAPQDARARFMTDLGFVQPPEIAELAAEEFSADVSLERLDLVDADVLVLIVNSIESDRARIEAEPLFANRRVKTDGRVVYVENLSALGGATSFVSALSLPFLVDELVPKLAAAVDGDPTTN